MGGRRTVFSRKGRLRPLRELRSWDGQRCQGTLATGVARDYTLSSSGWPSGRERNGLQPGQGATELGFPRPAPGEMQSEAARRAGDPSHQSEDPPPEGLGDHGPLAQTNPRRPAGQVMRHHLDRQPGAVGGEARRRHVVQPDAVLEVAYGVLDRRGGDDRPSSSVSPSRSVMKA